MQASTPLKHGSAEITTGVRLRYVEAGTGPRTMVLLHGYPQTWWEWRHAIPLFAQAGFRVIAPDYRGAGGSSKPPQGYDKRTMAADIEVLLRQHLGVKSPIVLVGHDIGMMVAYAFASSFPKSVERLVLMEAPLPGTLAYNATIATTHLTNVMDWHFFFHNATDNLAELLTQGRERQYLKSFYDRLAFNPDAIGLDDLDVYASQYESAGAMRAGFELYRAFDRDADDNRACAEKAWASIDARSWPGWHFELLSAHCESNAEGSSEGHDHRRCTELWALDRGRKSGVFSGTGARFLPAAIAMGNAGDRNRLAAPRA